MNQLTIDNIIKEYPNFILWLEGRDHAPIYNKDNGKTIGSYLEKELTSFLKSRYSFVSGNAAIGLDFPSLGLDVKYTRPEHPQSSAPFNSPEEKLWGLGYGLLVSKYQKFDDHQKKTSKIKITSYEYIPAQETGDKALTERIARILKFSSSVDSDLRDLLLSEGVANSSNVEALLAKVKLRPPAPGKIRIYNALQWRLAF